LKKSWWILLVRGLTALLFGAFALVGGTSDAIGSIVNRK
jgi:uncharacterized membrane protein HdeD (DUF308 family)